MGVAIPTSKDINQVFYTGFDMSLGVKWATLPGKKLWVKPVVGMKMYTKNTDIDGDNVNETFIAVKTGLELQYPARQWRKYALYPLLRVDYNWYSNYFSRTYNESQIGTIRTYDVAVSDKFLKGNGPAFDAGCMFLSKAHWYIRADYEYCKPSLTVYPDFVREAQEQGIYVPSTVRLDCSSINLTIGANFNFR